MTTLNLLKSVGLDESLVGDFVRGPQSIVGDFELDSSRSSAYWGKAQALLNALPAKVKRTADESLALKMILDLARLHRQDYLRVHASTVYNTITQQKKRFLRLDALLELSQHLVPGLTPSKEILAKELELIQSQKDGHEIDQGLFLSYVLADQSSGLHLCHAMLLEHPTTAEHRERFTKEGRLDLEGVSLHHKDNATHLVFQNGKYLNAEDDMTLANTEVAADLAILDPSTNIAVMRGSLIEEGKYKGERTFCSGINLTRLYNGKIPYLWYIERDMGIVNKIYRGLAMPEHSANEILGQTKEKLWIAVVDQFAIGGGCQYLLVTDINIAGDNAYLTLPARKEGIIPGVANMRLPRFVGDRMARQAIMMEKRIECESDMGRMICDEVVASEDIEATLLQTIEKISSSGVVSASGNRKAFRVAQEPLDQFRQYMSVYAKEQAYCHFSPALISNLEKNWDARNRKLKG